MVILKKQKFVQKVNQLDRLRVNASIKLTRLGFRNPRPGCGFTIQIEWDGFSYALGDSKGQVKLFNSYNATESFARRLCFSGRVEMDFIG